MFPRTHSFTEAAASAGFGSSGSSASSSTSFFDAFNPAESMMNARAEKPSPWETDPKPGQPSPKCPVSSFERAMEINLRAGPQCHPAEVDTFGSRRDACCDAIERAKFAADDAERAILNNWYIRHCSAMPFPLAMLGGPPRGDETWFLDPFVEWVREKIYGADEEEQNG